MNLNIKSLPDDTDSLKEFIASQQLEFKKIREENAYLKEMVRLLRNEIFGRKSESRKVPDLDQLQLFDTPDVSSVPETADVTVPSHKRGKRGRKPLPKNLERIEVVHDIPEDQKQCPCGAELSRIGEEVSEKLDYVPAKIRIIRHVRPKYACKSCEGVEDNGSSVKIAPAPKQLIPKSIATERLLAHVMVSKFADALPLYRQQKIFVRHGLDLSRATLANWVIKAAFECVPIIDLFQKEIRGGPLINIDESPLQVLKEPGRSNITKSYMWVFCGGTADRRAVVYQYHPTRSGQVALEFLNGYEGYVQSDAFSGYEHLGRQPGISHLGCWVHVRRKFVEVTKARKKSRGKKVNVKSLADQALDLISQLYSIEKHARSQVLTTDQIRQLRQDKAKPILDYFKCWLDAKQHLTPPNGLLGKAIQYALNHWSKLTVYIEEGHLKPDNNVAENAIRPFVVGRKNWLFAGAPKGAEASATFFSLIETAKANLVEPYNYLLCLFEKLPFAEKHEDYVELLPWNFEKKN